MEEWRPIQDYPDYQVSSLGRVKSMKWGKEEILTLNTDHKGYHYIGLQPTRPRGEEGVRKCVKVHRLVAEAFIPNLDSKPQIDHIDRCKSNNVVSNLRWATAFENSMNCKVRKSKTGHTNITRRVSGFQVNIRRGGKSVFFKMYSSLEDAILGRDEFLSK